MDQVMLESADWSSGAVPVARTFLDRLRGLMRSGVEALLIETRSVHGIGMSRPFRAVGLSESLEVRDSRVVRPFTLAYFAGCRYVLELPVAATSPVVGSSLELRRV